MIAAHLLKAGAEVDARDNEGYTPLHWAAAENSNELVLSLLIEAGADPAAMDGDGLTPLHFALLFQDRRTVGPVVATLLQSGAGAELAPLHLEMLTGDRTSLAAAMRAGGGSGRHAIPAAGLRCISERLRHAGRPASR